MRARPSLSDALLVLEDGTVFAGEPIGAPARAHGEVVFTTAMTGYQEALTDPSFAGQVLVMTYPLQGNYGVNDFDVESRRIQARAFIVREDCGAPSHWRSKGTLHEYLREHGIPGIAGVDTRALTRKLRTAGVMM
ncbi:MAG: carbamoyl-phosphate synthase domain-containing protein, partial [Dehalococcoidia bacterium]